MISCKLGLSFNGQQGEPKSVGRQVLAAGFIAAGIIDGARLILNSHEGRVDLFALQVDADRSGYFDNNPSRSRETVWGRYPTFPLTTKSTAAKLKNIRLNLFYIGFQHVGGSYQSARYQKPVLTGL